MQIQNEYGVIIDTTKTEVDEQKLANIFIEENDVVFELGARYGSVSCIINNKLKYKTNPVSVEPDERVWSALEKNKEINNCNFHIVKGFVSNKKLGLSEINSYGGYGTTSVEDINSKIPSFSFEEIKEKYNLNFNVLVADCEGFLEIFFDENPSLYNTLNKVIFEADYPNKCNYNKIKNNLNSKGFKNIINGFQNVWIKC
jgi:FkbM family methyltransferase